MDFKSTSATSSSPVPFSPAGMPAVPGAALSGSLTSSHGSALVSPPNSVTEVAFKTMSTSPGTTPPSSPQKREPSARVSSTYLSSNFKTIEYLKSQAETAKNKTEEKAHLREEFALQGQKRREKLEETMRQLEEQMRLAKDQFTSESQVEQEKFDEKRHLINYERRKKLSECKKKEKYIDKINAHLIERSKVLRPFIAIQRIGVRTANENFQTSIAKMQGQIASRLTEAVEKANVLPEEIMARVQILGKLYYLEQQMDSYQISESYFMAGPRPFDKECLNKRCQQMKDTLGEIRSSIKNLSTDNKSSDVVVIKSCIESCLSRVETGLTQFQSKEFMKQIESSNIVDSIFMGEDIPTLDGPLKDFNQFVQQFHALRALLDVEAIIQIPLSKEMIEKQAQELKGLQEKWNEKYPRLLSDIDKEKARVKEARRKLTKDQKELDQTYEEMNSTITANRKKKSEATQPEATQTERKGGRFLGMFG